jgi:hypothetical protein
LRHDWGRPEAVLGRCRPVSIGPSRAPLARPDPCLALRAAPGGIVGGGTDARHTGQPSMGLRRPRLAGLEASPSRNCGPRRGHLYRADPVEARAGPAGLRHARDCHPRNRRLGPAGPPAAPSLCEPASGGWQLGDDRWPGPGGRDPRHSSSKLALVKPSARLSPVLTTRPGGWVVPAGGYAVSDARNHPGGGPPRPGQSPQQSHS